MKTAEVRSRFVDYFVARGHDLVPGVPLPFDDPNLLLVNSGMVQFVPYYSGDIKAPWARAASVQKCIRTVDIDEVGKTTRHGTFFQMCGNFCFGDYFREEAIAMAWELVTSAVAEGGYGLEPDRIWPTVFETDEEAFDIWHRKIGIPAARIQKRGRADNLWSMGIPGPCGPSSELFYDRGPAYGREGGPEVDEDRYMEFWNLVFMTSVRGPGTTKEDFEIVGRLPHNNIDTGMGLERMATLLQGVDNLYEIDETRPVLELAADLAGKKYGAHSGPSAGSSHPDDIRLRVIADHVRTALMLIGDGVSPGNEGRGYVLRRIMRRAIRSARQLGIVDPVFPTLLPVSRDAMSASFPELATDYDRISMIATGEEEVFLRTLSAGTTIVDTAVRRARDAAATSISGSDAFTLHDTYGFPIDLTIEIAAENDLTVDETEFRRLMTEQRQRAKTDARTKKLAAGSSTAYRELRDHGATVFTGYETLDSDGRVLGVIRDGELVPAATPGEIVEVVLDRTSFYAESGGQVADEGTIISGDTRVRVLDVQKPIKDLFVHRVQVEVGELRPGLDAETKVDPEWRTSARQAHSGTHILHAALREVLGPSALQSGSYNKPGYLRLDFAWSKALSDQIRLSIEETSNRALRRDLPVSVSYMALSQARELGALALFGETYDVADVRVVEIGGAWSRELCGGTHVSHSSQVGSIALLGDSSIGTGVRRIEAYVGMDAVSFLANERALVNNLSTMLKVPRAELPDRISALVERLRTVEKELERARSAELNSQAGSMSRSKKTVNGIHLVAVAAPANSKTGDLRSLVKGMTASVVDGPAVVLLTSATDGTIYFVCAVNERAVAAGVSAVEVATHFTAVAGGRGGGSPQIAQGGGGDSAKVERGFVAVERMLAGIAG